MDQNARELTPRWSFSGPELCLLRGNGIGSLPGEMLAAIDRNSLASDARATQEKSNHVGHFFR